MDFISNFWGLIKKEKKIESLRLFCGLLLKFWLIWSLAAAVQLKCDATVAI